MSATIKIRHHKYEIEENMPLGKVLKRLNLNPLSVLAVRNGTLITEDEIVRNQDEIELIEVVSGG